MNLHWQLIGDGHVSIVLCSVQGEDQLVLMTREFDPLSEVSLYESEFGEG